MPAALVSGGLTACRAAFGNEMNETEKLRQFFARREFLRRPGTDYAVITPGEWDAMKAGDEIPIWRRAYLLAFMDGWLRSKQ